MSASPAGNPIASRADVARILAELSAPLAGRASAGGARLDLGPNGAQHSDDCAGIESFARPLWGLVPWAAGGGDLSVHAWVLRGLANGFDPGHAEYWGEPKDYDQRFVEMAPVAFAVLAAPATLIDPLPATSRAQIAQWLERANRHAFADNNWPFFRVLANLALERLGGRCDEERLRADLDRVEQFHLGEGWSSDGANEQRDHYVAFAMHFYALLYCAFAGERDPQRCARFRQRATVFARDYARWFDAEGAAIPIGRSLGYRFAQGAFWGALAYSGVEALPWAEVKGLWLRNLRWWLARPIVDRAGILAPGYAYPNAEIGEQYIGPGSPYWAFKAFLPLALAQSHAFWQAAEAEPDRATAVSAQPHPRLVICRADAGRHVFALNAGQWASWRPRHDSARYAKFCYSSRFGFSVSSAHTGFETGAHDSMLALTEDGEHFRVRRETTDHEVRDRLAASTWKPWPDVVIRTWLVAAPPWHLRVHRIHSRRALTGVEAGFAFPIDGTDRLTPERWRGGEGVASAEGPWGRIEVRDLDLPRVGIIYLASPGTNVMAPRTAIPALMGEIRAGVTWLACAVLGSAASDPPPMPFQWKPTFRGFRLQVDDFTLEFER